MQLNKYLSLILSSTLLVIFCASSASAEPAKRLKDGRHYVRELSRSLDIPMFELRPVFNEVKLNLPQTGDISEFHSAKDSMAKLANYACDVVDFMMGPELKIDDVYMRLLKREPTAEERAKSIKVNGKFSFYSNCLVVALSPEFIFVSK